MDVYYSCPIMECKDSVVVVTGGAQRLGRRIALALADQGCNIVVHYHTDAHHANETVHAIKECGGEAVAIAADLITMEGVDHLVTKTLEAFGRWDALINCASLFETVGIEEVDVEQWTRDQNLHQRSPFFLAKALYSHVKERSGETCACVVNITDTGVSKPVPSRPSYYIAKSALQSQTTILGRSLAPYVRVNAVAPGAIIPASPEDAAYFARLEERLPLGRLASVDDVVAAVLFLLGNDSVTGQTIVVDGGEHLL